ncbi:MAG: hypothetical protein HQL39_19855 [Alphaproteobacteria bacterium]|nr:hypothetical protein [Alphaproteobacteria bacterium]
MITPYLARELRRSKTIEIAALVWMAPLVEPIWEYEAPAQIARVIRAAGGEMNAEEKRALGLRSNTIMGRLYWNALTETGRKKPLAGLDLILDRALLAARRDQAPGRRPPGWPLRFSAILDSRTCSAAAALHGRIFHPDDAPGLPLPDCDRETCRCLLHPIRPAI